ncbi:MAG: TetR/AcrR family transcriptional regulator [Gammaproteobacteria bacterium]|nr:TetR/AcrR family transcriptional regulator [Gammaproteobacteria bacterium]
MTEHRRSAARREAILQAALACFTEHGVEATSIEMIRERSGASTGSLYHHFGSKEAIAATLFIQGLKDYADRLIGGLQTRPDARDGIRWMVTSYIDWILDNPDWARYIFTARGQVIRGEAQAQLQANNQVQFTALKAWMTPHIQNGTLPKLPMGIYHALVNGPVQDYCRSWLAGRVKESPRDVETLFADAAWRSVSGLLTGS